MNDEKDNLEFKLGQYLDGELDGQEALDIEKLVLRQPEARRQLQQYARLEKLLGEMRLQQQLAKADFDFERQAIMAKLERSALMRPRLRMPMFRLAMGGLAAAAAVLIITTAAMMILRNSGAGPTGTPQIASTIEVIMHRASPLAKAGLVQVKMSPQAAGGQVAVDYRRVQDTEFPLAPPDAVTYGPEQLGAEEPSMAVMFHGGGANHPSELSALDPLLME